MEADATHTQTRTTTGGYNSKVCAVNLSVSKIIARPFSLLIISLGNEPSAERVSGAEIAARVEEQSRAEAIIKHKSKSRSIRQCQAARYPAYPVNAIATVGKCRAGKIISIGTDS